jgi:hypothetical protein
VRAGLKNDEDEVSCAMPPWYAGILNDKARIYANLAAKAFNGFNFLGTENQYLMMGALTVFCQWRLPRYRGSWPMMISECEQPLPARYRRRIVKTRNIIETGKTHNVINLYLEPTRSNTIQRQSFLPIPATYIEI